MPCRLLFLLAVLSVSGCATWSLPEQAPALQPQAMLPGRHQLRVAQCLFLSDFELKADHPLLKELEGLGEQIRQELRLPPSGEIVYVYLFADQTRYEAYLSARHPELPPRRAYFMTQAELGQAQRLYVLAQWGDLIQKDLRHELTHAALHGVLKDVPLWLDEGLAEFFETPPQWQGVNHRHLHELKGSSGGPWKPDLARLETLTQVRDMTAADYREAWAWVHFLLRGSPKGRAVLLGYLAELRTNPRPSPLSVRLKAAVPEAESALREHLAELTLATRAIRTEAAERE